MAINLPEDPLSLKTFLASYAGRSGGNHGMLRSLTSLIEKLSEGEPMADEESKQGDEKTLITLAAN
jgi:hypothetical protein